MTMTEMTTMTETTTETTTSARSAGTSRVRCFHFSEFELDLDRFCLRRAGRVVDIGPRSLDLLAYLIEHRDRVVSPERLRDSVWEGVALSPSAIPTCVRELRRALGDDARTPRFIETVRGRGYRFLCPTTTAAPSPDDRWSLYPTPFVGRERERALVDHALRRMIAEGTRHTVLIRGDAGAGKTRLLDELARSLPPDAAVERIDGSSLPDPSPLLDPHRPPVSRATPDRLSSESDGGLDALVRRAAERPVVVLLDDLHRADPAALTQLDLVLRQARSAALLVVATERTGAGDAAVRAGSRQLAGAPQTYVVHLEPLVARDIDRLLDALDCAEDATASEILATTGGSPLFVTHYLGTLGTLRAGRSCETPIGSLRLPTMGSADLLAIPLRDLPESCRQALKAAAIVGHRFPIRTIAAILELDPNETITVLRPAIESGLLQEDDSSRSHFHFVHPMLRDALCDALDCHTRRSLHLRAGSALIEHGDGAGRSAAISDHLDQALPLAPRALALQHTERAAANALARFAFGDARRYLERAIGYLEDEDERADPDRCALLLRLARAQLYDKHPDLSRRTVLEAARLARRIESPQRLADCALTLAPDLYAIEVGGYDLTLIRLLEEAIEAASDADDALRAHLLSRLALAQHWSGQPEGGERSARRALAEARRSSSAPALMAALSAWAESLQGPARAEERVEVLRELGEIAWKSRDIPMLVSQQTRLVAALIECGLVDEAEAENTLCADFASEAGLPQLEWYPESLDTMFGMLRGDLRPRPSLDALFEKSRQGLRDGNIFQGYASQQIYRQIEQDRSAGVVGLVAEFVRTRPRVRSWRAALAWLQWDAGLLREAHETLLQFDPLELEVLSREPGGGIGLAGLCEVAAALGNLDACERLLPRIDGLRDKVATAGYGVVYFGSLARYAALLELALERAKDAVASLERAGQHELQRGAPIWQAYAEIDRALALHAAGASRATTRGAWMVAQRIAQQTPTPRLRRRLEAAGRVVWAGDPGAPR